jgi:hypothetical protein
MLSLGNIFQYMVQNPGLVPSMCLSPVSIGLCSITTLSAYMVGATSSKAHVVALI